MENNAFEKIYELVKQIPPGHVASYGQIASLAGNKRWSRVVGYALNVCPEDSDVPCHRVVNREGRLSDVFLSNGINRQKVLLEKEGVKVEDNFVDMKKYQWKKVIF